MQIIWCHTDIWQDFINLFFELIIDVDDPHLQILFSFFVDFFRDIHVVADQLMIGINFEAKVMS